MAPRLLTPADAAAAVADALTSGWSAAVCAELGVGDPVRIEVGLRPGVTRPAAATALGLDRWQAWAELWRAEVPGPGTEIVRAPVFAEPVPRALVVTGLDAALAWSGRAPRAPGVDVDRARRVASALQDSGAALTPATLAATCRLDDGDVQVATGAVRWLREHPHVGGWTARQLPVPGMHTKWLAAHGGLLRTLAGRDVRDEVRPRLAVVHLTYVDPDYLASGGRRHDAWTTGDSHEPAYRPRIVLVVENRDCRLCFPPLPGALVVEGGGSAAAALLAEIPWVRGAEVLAYWGDLDADGFAILDRFRAELREPGASGSPREVASILMDGTTLERYAHLGGTRDRRGRELRPSSTRLPHLTAAEAAAYHALATAGPAPVRRVEQERLPIEEAAAALETLARRA